MTFAVARSDLQTILNRRDLTDAQTNVFLKKGIRRINREVRCPAQETTLTWTCDGTPFITIPADYLELIALFTNDTQGQDKLRRTDLQRALRWSNQPGYPQYFHRIGSQFLIGPCPPAGTKIYVSYYQNANETYADGDESWLTLTSPDLLTYAALTRAADFYLDDRKSLFESTYQEIKQGLMDMASTDELDSACISPAYTTDFW